VGGAFFRISRFLAAARLPWSFFAQIVPPGNVVMTIDNPFQSPNAESLENPGVVLHSRNNWTGYSPEYNAAPKTAMLVQAVLAVVTSLVPDFGHTHRAFRVAFLCQWARVWIILFRPPMHPIWFDLSLVRYGIVPVLFIVAGAGPWFLRLPGVQT
jgi:hypothetical protein